MVSIPFTSGHVFRQRGGLVFPLNSEMSQSLLHQVTYSDNGAGSEKRSCTDSVSIPFTSGHVFRHSMHRVSFPFLRHVSIPFTSGHVFRQNWTASLGATPGVSIPFTSGHVFRRPDRVGGKRSGSVSQSLLHQVTYSDFQIELSSPDSRRCLNPFYIRSRIPTIRNGYLIQEIHRVSIPFTSGHVFRPEYVQCKLADSYGCLNPFYIRSRIPTRNSSGVFRDVFRVSIPFTSGHVFRPGRPKFASSIPMPVSIPFTSGHVFRPRTVIAYILVLIMSQSLLHQVTYSDHRPQAGGSQRRISVSIPFTSGHVFRLSEGIEVSKGATGVSIPFTSGHVFRPSQNGVLYAGGEGCLNPFYIRSRIPTNY